MGFFDSILPEDSNTRGNVLDAVQALGMGLLQGDRDHPFGNNMAQNLAAIQAGNKSGMSRQALQALLIQRGFSPEDAAKFSANEAVAKLAIEGKQGDEIKAAAGSYFGGGPVSNLGAPMPKLSPDAPSGPAAGVSLNGSQSDRAKAVYDGLIQRGISPVLAAGMTGNVGAESGFDPNAKGDNGTAFGYHQARGDRAQNLRAIAQKRGVAWNDHDAQLDNIASEFNGGDAGMVKARRLIEADPKMTPEKAAAIIAQYGERPNAQALQDSLPKRAGLAAQAYSRFGQAPTQVVADASGAVPISPVTRSNVAPLQAGASKPADPAADMPAPNAQTAQFQIPPGAANQGAPRYAPDSTTARALAVRQQAGQAADTDKVRRGLSFIARYGDTPQAKGLTEAIKLDLQPALKNMEKTEAEKLADAAGLSAEQKQDVLAGAIGGNAKTSLQKEYASYAKQEQDAGRTPLSQIDYDIKVRGASKPEQNTTIRNVTNPIAQGVAEQFNESRKAAIAAQQSIRPIHDARALLDEGSGIFSGSGADTKLKLAKIGSALGITNPKVERTETFAPVIGQQVLANIKILGANPSNSDRDFAEKMAGGQITLNEGSMRRILDINERAARQRIQAHNEQVGPLVDAGDEEIKPIAGILKVKEPDAYQKAQKPAGVAPGQTAAPASPAGIAEGATATNPKTGERVVRQNGRWVPIPAQSGGVL